MWADDPVDKVILARATALTDCCRYFQLRRRFIEYIDGDRMGGDVESALKQARLAIGSCDRAFVM